MSLKNMPPLCCKEMAWAIKEKLFASLDDTGRMFLMNYRKHEGKEPIINPEIKYCQFCGKKIKT